MLKQPFENKKIPDNSEPVKAPVIDIGGNMVDLDQLHRMRGTLLKEIAHEQDPEAIGKASVTLAQINSGIAALESVETARGEVDRHKEAARQKEIEIADAGRRRFLQNIKEIAGPSLERMVDLPHPVQADRDEELAYIKTRNAYLRKLDATLGYDDAEKQAHEIYVAGKERREWVDLVKLPNPDPLKSKTDMTDQFAGIGQLIDRMYSQ